MTVAVIPAYQAQGSVGAVVRGLAGRVAEVIVVDDGSDDATAAEAETAGARVLRHRENRGKAAALRTGFAAALAGSPLRVASLDADGQHDPADLPALEAMMDRTGSPVVVGSRLHDLSDTPAYRHRTNRIGGAVIAWLVGMPLRDVQSGFRLYDAGLLSRISIRGEGFSVDSEILVRACRMGYLPATAPIRVIYGEEARRSHFRPIPDTYHICITVARIILGLL